MAAFLTHWRVLIETARRSQDAGSDLGSLIVDTTALQRRLSGLPPQTTPAGAVWNTGPLPEIGYDFPGSDISALAYLGALAPDIPGFRGGQFKRHASDAHKLRRADLPTLDEDKVEWATLLHTNRSGDLLLAFLEYIAVIPSPALRSQALAFCLGYLSHIATDIALNPWINVLASQYRYRDIPAIFVPLGIHFYIELCLDEYLATTYFEHPPYSWLNQPWHLYIEPAARNLITTTDLTTQILNLLVTTTETTYSLTEAQTKIFQRHYIAGLQQLRHYLAGRGRYRWLAINAHMRQRMADPIVAIIAKNQLKRDVVTSEQTIEYAIRLSERLCRRAISYYASLRNTNATAEERNQRYTAIRNDLRNWDLYTGYTLEVSFDQEVTLRYLHNWLHFADLWDGEAPGSIQAQKTLAE